MGRKRLKYILTETEDPKSKSVKWM
jgi:hypothetical protein